MPIIEDRSRQVVPRWRPFGETVDRGELLPAKSAAGRQFSEEDVANQLSDWKQSPTLSVACDLVSVALTLGLNKVAVDAAEYIIEQPLAPAIAVSLATIYLKNAGIHVPIRENVLLLPEQGPGSAELLTPMDGRWIAEIHRLKAFLADYPRNPIDWCNLALYYTSLGALEKAERAITVALSLAPHSRFVLRAASRFFLHSGDPYRARQILMKSPLVRSDPWVMAAEIATADTTSRPSSLMKVGRRLLDAGRFEPRHISELASALGTIEVKAGNARAGRKIVDVSLQDPSENSIAQAVWLRRSKEVNIDVPQAMTSPEAATWTYYYHRRWRSSLDHAQQWQDDQPFSSRPAMLASFLASAVFGQFEEAKHLAMTGLRSNPDDPWLLNNYSFAAAMNGDTAVAEQYLRRIPQDSLKDQLAVSYFAMEGLISFRSGHFDLGRLYYKRAIQLAKVQGDQECELQAQVHLALEEDRIGSEVAYNMCQEALERASKLDSAMGAVLVHMINNRGAVDSASR